MAGAVKQSITKRARKKFGGGVHAQLAHDFCPVFVDSVGADAETVGNDGIAFSARNAEQNLTLATGQRIRPVIVFNDIENRVANLPFAFANRQKITHPLRCITGFQKIPSTPLS